MDKQKFVMLLGELLKIAVDCIDVVELINDATVCITFEVGTTRKVNIAGDSYIAIIKDVVEKLTD